MAESDPRRRALLALARSAVEAAASGGDQVSVDTPPELSSWLGALGATFVTLRLTGELRGCIGSVRARRALRDDVQFNARAAAVSDPRFPPVTALDLPRITVEVSVLSALEPLPWPLAETEAGTLLRPGVDGVVLESGAGTATFLPQVWEQLPEPAGFLAALKQKAGLPPGPWPAATRLSRYTVEKFGGE
jgi:AmmeMemoRadiSam system protein A